LSDLAEPPALRYPSVPDRVEVTMAPMSKPVAKRPSSAKIDEEIEESFPASDPPAFMAGHVGAPKRKKARKAASAVSKKIAKTPVGTA
jgi:hypothetical protein